MAKANTLHIGIFGRMNVGKSSLINALVSQNISIVDSNAGTTTDPVKKTVELPGIGPAVFIDTPGIDDDKNILGQKRVAAAFKSLEAADIAIIVFDSDNFGTFEESLISECKAKNIKYILVHNKSDIAAYKGIALKEEFIEFSSVNPNPQILIKAIARLEPSSLSDLHLLNDIVNPGQTVVLVIPIDAQAPHGRIILPQVQTLRNILDIGAVAVCLKDTELETYIKNNNPPKLVVTDSQAFNSVSSMVPQNIWLTSFSILFARAKADFNSMLLGAKQIENLKNGDNVLILESCAHRTQTCDDIGRSKIPKLLQKYTGAKLNITVISGLDPLPENLSQYKFAVQCGGCMHTNKQIANRLNLLAKAGVKFSNYGMVIAYCNGILKRATQMFNIDNYD